MIGAASLRRLRRPATLAVVGGLSTLLYAALAFLGTHLTPLPAAVASLMAYGSAAGLSYLAHRAFTFRLSGSHAGAPLRFAALSLAGYGIAFAAPLLLTDMAGYPPILPILVTCIAVPVFNAWALARLVFRAPLTSPAEQGSAT